MSKSIVIIPLLFFGCAGNLFSGLQSLDGGLSTPDAQPVDSSAGEAGSAGDVSQPDAAAPRDASTDAPTDSGLDASHDSGKLDAAPPCNVQCTLEIACPKNPQGQSPGYYGNQWMFRCSDYLCLCECPVAQCTKGVNIYACGSDCQ